MAILSYNGLNFETLPARDETTYPVGLIIHCLCDDAIALYGAEYVFAYGTSVSQPGRYVLNGFGGMYCAEGEVWVASSFSADSIDITYDGWYEPVWTDTTIYSSDGTIYLPASKPVAVSGELNSLNDFVMMFLAGLMTKGEIR